MGRRSIQSHDLKHLVAEKPFVGRRQFGPSFPPCSTELCSRFQASSQRNRTVYRLMDVMRKVIWKKYCKSRKKKGKKVASTFWRCFERGRSVSGRGRDLDGPPAQGFTSRRFRDWIMKDCEDRNRREVVFTERTSRRKSHSIPS